MAQLFYLPKNAKDPKNHPRRLYFSCHPDDCGLMEEIYGDIQKFCEDFVLFYPDLSQRPVQWDHLDEVANAQLLVMPVTKKLLTDENGAYLAEFRRAEQERLAILPILYEPEAEGLFNDLCDRRQMVAKWDGEYEEKLKRALDGALLTDDVTQRVREVFKNRIFVSYCREDKPYAEQVIRLIHQSKDLRMVSIWYDKYLTLGRDFEQTLKEKLEHCQLFALTVTPNLISRETYVKNTEYPAAKTGAKAGEKSIFPVEMLSTDQQQLIDYFNRDPAEKEEDAALLQLIGADSPKALSQKLADKIRRALPERLPYRTPDTNYLLGMAYLNGIEVEYDRGFARDILAEAANAGSFEAISQLVTMYSRGIGTQRDPKTAIRWNKKAVEKRRATFQKALAEADKHFSFKGDGVVFSPKVLKDIEKQIKSSKLSQQELAKQLTEVQMVYCEQACKAGSEYCRELLGFISLLVGEYEYKLVDWCYDELNQAKAEVDKRFPGANFMRDSANTWRAKQGQLDTLLQKKDGHSARESYEAAKAAHEEDPEDFRKALVFCGCSQIYAYELMSNAVATAQPAQILSASLALLEKLRKKAPDDRELLEILTQTLRDMGSFLRKLAQACRKEPMDFGKDLDMALELYAQCLQVWQLRWELPPENPYWIIMKAEITGYIAQTHLLKGQKEAAIAYFLKAMACFLQIEQDSRGKNYGADYLSSLYQTTPRIFRGLLEAGFTDTAYMHQTLAEVIEILERDPQASSGQLQRWRAELVRVREEIH